MTWCYQATNHYRIQCRPRPPHTVTRSQWVNCYVAQRGNKLFVWKIDFRLYQRLPPEFLMRMIHDDPHSGTAWEQLQHYLPFALQWRHNEHDSVPNHQPHHCWLNRLFRRRSKKKLKLRVTGLCAGTGEFPAQMASNAENVSISLRLHGGVEATVQQMDSRSPVDFSRSLASKGGIWCLCCWKS